MHLSFLGVININCANLLYQSILMSNDITTNYDYYAYIGLHNLICVWWFRQQSKYVYWIDWTSCITLLTQKFEFFLLQMRSGKTLKMPLSGLVHGEWIIKKQICMYHYVICYLLLFVYLLYYCHVYYVFNINKYFVKLLPSAQYDIGVGGGLFKLIYFLYCFLL